jgi:HK97 family phage prohead protease
MREQEYRQVPGAVELRASDNGIGVLVGYAAVFNKRSQNLGGFVEEVDPAAFNKSLGDKVPVVARFNHKDDFLLGTTEADTLRLSVDSTGLQYEVDLPDTQAGRDVAVLARRGDLRYSSFAFRTIKDEWGVTEDDFPLRTLKAVALGDVAPVVSPAYRDTTTGLRSLADSLHMPYEAVRAAADAGDLRKLLQAGENEGTEHSHEQRQVDNHLAQLAIQRQRLEIWSR